MTSKSIQVYLYKQKISNTTTQNYGDRKFVDYCPTTFWQKKHWQISCFAQLISWDKNYC